ncbi:MAG: hypothetical protein Q9208_005341 [Pyrenodesmia sp. 3 TL-2023]
MADVLTQVQTTLTELPPCAQTAIVSGITTSTCGLDIACVCQDDEFSALLQTTLAESCNRHDQEVTLSVARKLCVAALPSLLESRGKELVATVTVMLIIATIAVILRLYARRISRSKLGVDDYLIIVALILTYGLDINAFYSIKAGVGRHMITLTLSQIISLIKTDQASQVLFGCSITATKLSILFFYHRLFPFRTFFIISLVAGFASILWWIGLMLTAFLHCRPFAYYWDRSIPNGYCVNDNLIGYSITGANIVTDLVVLVMPIPWLWGMNMTVPKRMAVVGLFILGSFVCIAGIVRIPLLAELNFADLSWSAVSVGVWVNVECNIGILSVCLPILRPLFSTKYSSSPVSRFTRILRTITNSSRFSSISENGRSSSDPEKGILSDPGSDATAFEGLRWPNDSTAKGWRWSRNNSESTAVPIAVARPQPAQGIRQSEKEKEPKFRTWYSAAADVVPEIDFASRRPSRPTIDTTQIPRYRDDVEEEEKPLPVPVLSPREVERPKTPRYRGEIEIGEKDLPSPPLSPREISPLSLREVPLLSPREVERPKTSRADHVIVREAGAYQVRDHEGLPLSEEACQMRNYLLRTAKKRVVVDDDYVSDEESDSDSNDSGRQNKSSLSARLRAATFRNIRYNKQPRSSLQLQSQASSTVPHRPLPTLPHKPTSHSPVPKSTLHATRNNPLQMSRPMPPPVPLFAAGTQKPSEATSCASTNRVQKARQATTHRPKPHLVKSLADTLHIHNENEMVDAIQEEPLPMTLEDLAPSVTKR